MPDNISVTAGAGTIIAADDIGSVLYQRTKTTLGPDGTATGDWGGRAIGSTGAAVWVDPRPYSGVQAQASAALTIATTVYTIGDVLGSGWTFTGMARDSGGRGRLTGLVLIDKGDVTANITLYLASAAITFGTDNAAPSISDTDAESLLPTVTVGLVDLGGVRFGSLDSMSVPYECAATSLFVYAVTNTANAIFTAVTDLRLKLLYELD